VDARRRVRRGVGFMGVKFLVPGSEFLVEESGAALRSLALP
jgi:hypothetical protein